FQILSTAGAVVETRFGIAAVGHHPARVCLSEAKHCKGMPLRDAKSFIEVKWCAHADLRWPREERINAVKGAPSKYLAILELGSVPADKTVARRVICIQCRVRQCQAIACRDDNKHKWRAASLIQKRYRNHTSLSSKSATMLQCWVRRKRARLRASLLLREKQSAISVQCAYRRYKARHAAAYKRVIRTLTVIHSSGCSDPLYGPENCVVLDPADESTLWTSPYGAVEGQWIQFDLGEDIPVGTVRFLGVGNTGCPKQAIMNVRLDCCKTAKEVRLGDWLPVASFHLRMYGGWQAFELPRRLDNSSVARIWRVTFLSNFGNSAAIALHGIQFLLAKEESPQVLSQSNSQVVDPPPIGHDPVHLSISVVATAWPPPRYQWFHSGRLLVGETASTLGLAIYSPPSDDTRDFRCMHCKHARAGVPRNAYQISCGNCDTLHTYKEYEESLEHRRAWEPEVEQLEKAVCSASTNHEKAVMLRDKSKLEVCELEQGGKNADGDLVLKENEVLVTDAAMKLQEAREALNNKLKELLGQACKDPMKVCHPAEGFYECRMSNTRGGDILRTLSATRIYIFARDPPPLRLKVKMAYIPRERLRRRYWPKYAWAFGWFTDGILGGEVLMKYHDGAIYDGPCIAEKFLDFKGRVPSEAREPGHWGTWITRSGWTYEGPLVDNHFDIDNIHGIYRVTTPGGEVYEGEYVDQERHGIGEYIYADNTVYIGEWHRGQRQGFGKLESADGAVYEGEFDHDLIHGDGVWRWPDGSTYVGESKHGKREGKGQYITKMRDIYYGTYKDNKPNGSGIFKYCDGSSYSGYFEMGRRHGQGTYKDSKGVRSTGTWCDDKKNGIFEESTPVFIPELGESQDEIRTGLWEDGIFVEWVLPSIYPYATKQFYEVFEKDDDQYDGVYAMLVAKKLPFLPRGVDPNNHRVAAVVQRIIAEAGELCAVDTIRETEQKARVMAQVIHDKALGKLLSAQSLEKVEISNMEKQKTTTSSLAEKLAMLEANKEKLEAEVEQAYVDDPDQTRRAFLLSVEELKKLSSADWFLMRNYDEPPAVLASLMSAVCTLMMVRDSWKSARNLLGTSVQNMEEGDQEALHCSYDCKLIYRLDHEFNPYNRCGAQDLMMKLGMFVIDPRFKSDSYFLKTYGKALGPLVDLVGKGYNYILKAAEIKPRMMAITGLESSIKHTSIRLQEEREGEAESVKLVKERGDRTRVAKIEEEKARARLEKLQALLAEARGLVSVYVVRMMYSCLQ
ncbi:unnamed protein product, partial [Discosporangium mesarthrocarpum]